MNLSFTHAVPDVFAEGPHLVMDSCHHLTVWASRRARARQLQRDRVVSCHIPLCEPFHSSPKGLQSCRLPKHGAVAHSRNVCLVCSWQSSKPTHEATLPNTIFLTGREQGPLLVHRGGVVFPCYPNRTLHRQGTAMSLPDHSYRLP